MPDFVPHSLDNSICRTQLQDLRDLLASSDDLGESVFHVFFEPRSHLRAFVGFYNTSLRVADRVAWQYPIFSDFRSDFAIGDWQRKAYTFVEYEGARPNSLFVKHGDKATREYSSRFERGVSQVIDWFYKLSVMTDTPDMETKFGKRAINYAGVIITGRDQHFQPGEQMRLEWRQMYTLVNSRHIICITYDQLVRDLQDFLEEEDTPIKPEKRRPDRDRRK